VGPGNVEHSLEVPEWIASFIIILVSMSRLWAITSYFNPVGFKRRLPNYRAFRKHLGIPLATVELSFDGEFVLDDSDADILLRLEGRDVMWQKERLLNRLIEELPVECDMVAWIDCDVVFENADWASQTVEALETCGLVQLYDHRVNLSKEQILESVSSDMTSNDYDSGIPSAIYLKSDGNGSDDDFKNSNAPLLRATTLGLAYASPRAILKKHGLYDACILGSADRVITNSAFGHFDFAEEAVRMTGARKRHYRDWAEPFYQSIQARVGYIPGRLLHLWHGDLKNRQYSTRHDILIKHEFDPFVDITVNKDGLFEWASDKPQMHREVADYFKSRMEDD
jgi:hypothetical protein